MSKFMQISKRILNQRTTIGFNLQPNKINRISVNSFSSSSSTQVPPEDQRNTEPFIPPYEQKVGESIQVQRARLLYQSRKRGMLENGLLLSTFASEHLDSLSEPELKDYDRLINLPSNDWDIYYWATGVKPIPSTFDTPVMHRFIEHVKNKKKESRFQQPDLY